MTTEGNGSWNVRIGPVISSEKLGYHFLYIGLGASGVGAGYEKGSEALLYQISSMEKRNSRDSLLLMEVDTKGSLLFGCSVQR